MKSISFSFGGWRTEVDFGDALDLPRLQSALPAGCLFVFDSNTRALFGSGARDSIAIPAGEKAKTWESAEAILRRLSQLGMGRDATVIGVGGGVVSDITAFAASLYMRGCGLSLVPTTLLAMVDASLGGKTGIDFAGYKNLVGTFYPASRITIAVSALKSLPDREYLCGLAEAIKTAMIGDEELFSLLAGKRDRIMTRESSLLAEIVSRCLEVKGRIVSEDLREQGRRAVLNLGHTFAHALESCTAFSGWSHGEAVAWGIAKAVRAGLSMGVTEKGYGDAVIGILRAYGYTLEAGVDPPELLSAMRMDKKKKLGRIRLVLPKEPGVVIQREIEDTLALRILNA